MLLASVARAGAAPIALADDPTAGPASETPPPTCAERFPAEGPAGVDLRLGCIVGELVGLYTARDAGPPPPLSSYAIAAGLLVVGVLVALAVAGRLVAQRAGRRLAPVLPAEWWVCGTCRSVNGAGVAHCYSCGAGRTDGPTLPTDASPEIPQSFGDRRRRG